MNLETPLKHLGSQLGLKNLDPAIADGFKHSRALGLISLPFIWLRSHLQHLASHSLTAKYLPQVSFLMVLLLLFTLPFAESRASGLLVLCVSLLSALRLLLLDEDFPLSALVLLVCLFVAWGSVACAFSPFWKLSLYGYAKMLIYFLTYLCFIINFKTISQVRISAWVLVISAFLVSLYGLYQWQIKVPPLALWDDPSANYKITRVYSFLGNPNLLGGYLLPTLSVTGFFYFGSLGWRKLVLLGAFLAQAMCLYLTYSRGAWMALALGLAVGFVICLVIFWHIFASNLVLKSLLFLALIGGGLGMTWLILSNPALLERISSLFSGREHSSNNFRWNVWVSSVGIIKDYAWTGVGLGSKVFQKVYTYYMATGFSALSTYNVPLEIWLEMGLGGLFLFVCVLLSHLGRCLWGIAQEIDYSARLFLAAAFVGLLGLMTHGMVDTVFYRPPVQILFWYFLALITVVSQDGIAFRNQPTK